MLIILRFLINLDDIENGYGGAWFLYWKPLHSCINKNLDERRQITWVRHLNTENESCLTSETCVCAQSSIEHPKHSSNILPSGAPIFKAFTFTLVVQISSRNSINLVAGKKRKDRYLVKLITCKGVYRTRSGKGRRKRMVEGVWVAPKDRVAAIHHPNGSLWAGDA